MRRVLIFVLLIGASWAQNQLPTPIQVCLATATTCVFTNNVVSGNFIFIGGHSEGALTTPTDTRTTTWTLVDSKAPASSAGAYLWCGILGSGGAETITLTGSLSFQGLVAFEMAPFAGLTCTKDVSANGSTTSGTFTTSSVTTTKNGDFMLCYLSNFSSSGTPIPTIGGTFLGVGTQSNSDSSGMGYQFAGVNGSYSCTFDGASNSASYVIAAFKASAATMVTTALPSGSLTNSYSYTPQCVGAVGTLTWTASSLPSGLSINSSTGAITGTPTGPTTTPTITCTGGTSGTASVSTAPLTINSSVGTISVVSSCGNGAGLSCSLGTVTSGNCVLVSNELLLDQNIANPTDSLNTTFHYIGMQNVPGTGAHILEGAVWVGVATSTGSDTVTNSTGTTSVTAVQLSNCQGNIIDVASSTAGINSGSVTISGASLTTLAPGSEIWAVISPVSNATYTAGTGFSLVNGAVNNTQGIVANESSTGTYTPSFVQSGNGTGFWTEFGIALRPSTSGVVNTNHRRAWVISQP